MVQFGFRLYPCNLTRPAPGGCGGSNMAPKSSFGHPGVRFLRFWEDLIGVRCLMIFEAAPKMKPKYNRKWPIYLNSSGWVVLRKSLFYNSKTIVFEDSGFRNRYKSMRNGCRNWVRKRCAELIENVSKTEPMGARNRQ